MPIPLPVFEMVIDENPESDVEVSFVALVDKPAIERNFLAFNDQRLKLDFAIHAERQIISGPAMVADTLIYRKDAGGEYNVFFSKDTIEKIALKFFKQDYQKNLNLFHDPTLSLQGVTIFESFVSDKSRGVQPMKGFEDLPDGTWFISAKVENPNVWAKIQSGEVKGFSVEGIFSYMKKPKAEEKTFVIESDVLNSSDRIIRLSRADRLKPTFPPPENLETYLFGELNRTLIESGHIYPNSVLMSKVKDFIANIKKEFFDGTALINPAPPAAPPAAPAPTVQTMMDYKTKDGMAVSVDKLEVGGTALMNGVPAPAGEIEFEDGTKLTVGEGGVITAVTPAMTAAPALTMAEVEGMITKAITAYKEQMQQAQLLSKLEAAEKMLADHKTTMAAQDKKIQGLFQIVEKLADIPTADTIGENHLSFTKQLILDKDQKKQDFINMYRKVSRAN
jgi:hypothetical protein